MLVNMAVFGLFVTIFWNCLQHDPTYEALRRWLDAGGLGARYRKFLEWGLGRADRTFGPDAGEILLWIAERGAAIGGLPSGAPRI